MNLDIKFLKTLAKDITDNVLRDYVSKPADEIIQTQVLNEDIVKYTWLKYNLSSKDYEGMFDLQYYLDEFGNISEISLQFLPSSICLN